MKKFILSIILATFLIASPASAEFFRDIIVTSPNGIWTDSRAYNTLNDAIAAVGVNERTIKIVSPQTVTTLTVLSNVTLKFERDGSITNSGQLTLNTKNIIAENRQIFAGAGDIDFAVGSVVKSGWFSNLDEALDVTNDDTLTMVISEAETTTANMAVGNDVILRWESPFIITAAVGHTVSNIKNIEAGNYQLFAGAGDFDFLNGTELKLNWFVRLSSVLTWVEDEEVTIVVNEDSIVQANIIAAKNENIKVIPGGELIPDAGVTLTIGSFDCGLYQAFSGNGNIVFNVGSVIEVYPEWWGAKGDETEATITTAAINSALTTGIPTQLSTGNYLIDSSIIMRKHYKLIGTHRSHIITHSAITMITTEDGLGAGNVSKGTLQNLNLWGRNIAIIGVSLGELADLHAGFFVDNIQISNCMIGMQLIRLAYSEFNNIIITGDNDNTFTIGLDLTKIGTSNFTSGTIDGYKTNIKLDTCSNNNFESLTVYSDLNLFSEHELHIVDSANNIFNDFLFEHVVADSRTILLDSDSKNTVDTTFRDCSFVGHVNPTNTVVIGVIGNDPVIRTSLIRCKFQRIQESANINIVNAKDTLIDRCVRSDGYGEAHGFTANPDILGDLVANPTQIIPFEQSWNGKPYDKNYHSNTWIKGMEVTGWKCTESGTYNTDQHHDGTTINGSPIITLTGGTTYFTSAGQFVDVSTGFATAGPYQILEMTSTTITLDTNANATGAVHLTFHAPVWKPIITYDKKPSYWLNGVDNLITIADDAKLDFRLGNGTMIARVKFHELDVNNMLLSRNVDASNYMILGYYTGTQNYLKGEVKLVGVRSNASFAYVDLDVDTWYHIGWSFINGIHGALYFNGDPLVIFQETNIGGNYDIAASLEVGYTPGVYSNLTVGEVLWFNCELSSSDFKDLSNGSAIPFKYIGTTNIEIATGSLVIGKAYKITAQNTEDFTADGAFNNIIGTEFIATDTNVALDATNKVIQLGCVVNLNRSGIGRNYWLDTSGNELHGTVTKTIPINLPADHQESYVKLSVIANTLFTLPKGYQITSIIVKETAGNALTGGIDFGFTVNGVEVVSGMVVGANATVNCTLVAAGTIGATLTIADDIIYISDGDDNANWDGASLEVRVNMKRLVMID